MIAPIQMNLVAFDLDDTLAHSKTAVSQEMADALMELLKLRPVCIISGGRFEQFQEQVLKYLPESPDLERLHLMPTCGTRYFRWNGQAWQQMYAHDLTAAERAEAIEAVGQEAKNLGLWEEDDAVYGERIEDRGSQITYSALGQQAPVDKKKAWDPTGERREALREKVAARLLNLEVRAGGSTSIDITRKGIDKAYGIGHLADMEKLAPSEIHFVGDRLEPGGNDYPVLALGVTSRSVQDCDETLVYIHKLIGQLA